MKFLVAGAFAIALFGWATQAVADSRTEKYRSGGCEIERKYDEDGKFEKKVECKRGYRDGLYPAWRGEGKEEFSRGGCEVKREWKKDGEFKEEVKCR